MGQEKKKSYEEEKIGREKKKMATTKSGRNTVGKGQGGWGGMKKYGRDAQGNVGFNLAKSRLARIARQMSASSLLPMSYQHIFCINFCPAYFSTLF